MPTDTGVDGRPIVRLDASAAIALALEDHDAHAAMVAAVRGRRLGLAGHAWFETYSLQTRLPGDLRRSPAEAARLLAHNCPASAFLSASAMTAHDAEFARLGIRGACGRPFGPRHVASSVLQRCRRCILLTYASHTGLHHR